METNTKLNTYVNTGNSSFNRFALKLYLENIKQDAFIDDVQPLEIFKFICDKMSEHGNGFFSFVDQFEPYLDDQQLTLAQNLLLCRIVKAYLKKVSNRIDSGPDYEHYYENYLGYFTTWEDVLSSDKTEEIVSTTDMSTMLNDIIHRQIIKLSDDLESISVVQKTKVMMSLVKSLPAFSKIKKEQVSVQLNPQSEVPSSNVLEFTPQHFADLQNEK